MKRLGTFLILAVAFAACFAGEFKKAYIVTCDVCNAKAVRIPIQQICNGGFRADDGHIVEQLTLTFRCDVAGCTNEFNVLLERNKKPIQKIVE